MFDPELIEEQMDQVLQDYFHGRPLTEWLQLAKGEEHAAIRRSIQSLLEMTKTRDGMAAARIKDLSPIREKIDEFAREIIPDLISFAIKINMYPIDREGPLPAPEPEDMVLQPVFKSMIHRDGASHRTSWEASRLAAKILGVSVEAAMCLEWIQDPEARTVQALCKKLKTQPNDIHIALKELDDRCIISRPPRANADDQPIRIGDERVWNCVFGGSTLTVETAHDL